MADVYNWKIKATYPNADFKKFEPFDRSTNFEYGGMAFDVF
jgi:hypothetical protein